MKKRKVVYNNCYGGYSLSFACVKYMYDNKLLNEEQKENYTKTLHEYMKSREGSFILVNSKNQYVGPIFKREHFHGDEPMAELALEIYGKKHSGYEELLSGETAETVKLIPYNMETADKYPELLKGISFYMFDDDRHSKNLIEAVEAVGVENAGGDCATLAVAEISGNAYRIMEHDGREFVMEYYIDYDVF